jgi:hypothetical protein
MSEGRGRLHILVEGQTEETVVRDVLEPQLTAAGWWVEWSIVKTKRPAVGPAHRGGLSTWAKLENDIRNLLRDSSLGALTTLLDYYGFPLDAPGMSTRPVGSPHDRVAHVEQALSAHFNDFRFLPHLVLHELEAWVFAAHEELAELYGDKNLSGKLRQDVKLAGGPEMVNDDPATAPSKRLVRYRPDYIKVSDGPLAIGELGLSPLRKDCPHLDSWLASLGVV